MSRYDLVINGTPITVEILSVSGGQATVSVNGTTLQVKLPAGASAPAPRPSRAAPSAPSAPTAAAGSTPVKEAPSRPAAPAAPPVAAEGEEILAPMPGHIVKVLVRVGDDVSADTPVALMEAMKMENEIRSHVTGKVAAVRVNEGQTVRVNDVLVVIGA